MKNQYTDLLTEEVKKDLAKLGLIAEARDRSPEESDPLDVIQEFLSDTYDKYINQYNAFKKKIDKHLEDEIDKMSERFDGAIGNLKTGLRSGKHVGEEEKIKAMIARLEEVNTREEVYSIIEGMLEKKSSKMNFLEYILKQLV